LPDQGWERLASPGFDVGLATACAASKDPTMAILRGPRRPTGVIVLSLALFNGPGCSSNPDMSAGLRDVKSACEAYAVAESTTEYSDRQIRAEAAAIRYSRRAAKLNDDWAQFAEDVSLTDLAHLKAVRSAMEDGATNQEIKSLLGEYTKHTKRVHATCREAAQPAN
jgi:hypothetical protein